VCGRYFYTNLEKIKEISPGLYKILISDCENKDSIDICPGDEAPTVIRTKNGYVIEKKRWGFTSRDNRLIINARSETIRDKRTFHDLADSNRCIITASGYYEWRKNDRQKFAFSPGNSNEILYIAGLYRTEEDVSRFVILTRTPTSYVSVIHDRMPLILPDREAALRWLEGEEFDAYLQAPIPLNIDAVGDEQLTMQF